MNRESFHQDKAVMPLKEEPDPSLDKLKMTLAETYCIFDSSNIRSAKRVKKFVQKSLDETSDTKILHGLMNFQLATKSSNALSLLCEIKDSLDKEFFDQINEYLQFETTRDHGIYLLTDMLKSPAPSWLHKLLEHRLFSTLVYRILKEGSTTILACCLTAFITLLSSIPFQAGKHLTKFLYAFSCVVSFTTRESENNPEDIAYLKNFLIIYFNRLYTLYPSNFISYLQYCYGYESTEHYSKEYTETIKPMIENHKLQPDLVTENINLELSHLRWQNVTPHSGLAMSVNLDVGDNESKSVSFPMQRQCVEDSDLEQGDFEVPMETLLKVIGNLKYIGEFHPPNGLNVSMVPFSTSETPRNIFLHLIPTVLGSIHSGASTRADSFSQGTPSTSGTVEPCVPNDNTTFGGQYPVNEVALLRKEIESLNYRLQFERHRITFQELRNKSLLEETQKNQTQTEKEIFLASKINLLTIENDNLKTCLANQEAMRNKLKQEKEESEKKINEEKILFRVQTTDLIEKNQQLSDLLKSEQSLNKQMKCDEENLYASIDNFKHKIQDQETELLQLRESVSEIEQLQRSNASLQEFVRLYRENLDPKQIQESSLSKPEEVLNTDSDVIPHNNLLDAMSSHVEHLEVELSSAQSQISVLSRTIETLNTAHANNIKARDERLVDMQKIHVFHMQQILQLYQGLENVSNSNNPTEYLFGIENSCSSVPKSITPICSFEKFFSDVLKVDKKSNGCDFGFGES